VQSYIRPSRVEPIAPAKRDKSRHQGPIAEQRRMIVERVIGLTRCLSSLRALAVITHSALRVEANAFCLQSFDPGHDGDDRWPRSRRPNPEARAERRSAERPWRLRAAGAPRLDQTTSRPPNGPHSVPREFVGDRDRRFVVAARRAATLNAHCCSRVVHAVGRVCGARRAGPSGRHASADTEDRHPHLTE
jgi:hypothetical protein